MKRTTNRFLFKLNKFLNFSDICGTINCRITAKENMKEMFKTENIFNAPFVTMTGKTAANMYRLGYDERNSGNISILLDESEAAKYLDLRNVKREIPIGFNA